MRILVLTHKVYFHAYMCMHKAGARVLFLVFVLNSDLH